MAYADKTKYNEWKRRRTAALNAAGLTSHGVPKKRWTKTVRRTLEEMESGTRIERDPDSLPWGNDEELDRIAAEWLARIDDDTETRKRIQPFTCRGGSTLGPAGPGCRPY